MLRAMQQTQNLDSIQARSNPVNDDKRGPVNDELTGAAHATDPPHFWVVGQPIRLLLNLPKLVKGSAGVVPSDIGNGIRSIGASLGKPDDLHSASPLMRPRSSARWRAISCLTIS